MFGDGYGWVPDELVEGSDVHVLYQNPGTNEEKGERILPDESVEACSPAPLIGKSGNDLAKNFWPLAGLQRGTLSLGNVLRCRVGDHCTERGKSVKCNHLPRGKILEQAVEHCTRAYFQTPASTRLFVAGGALAWKLLGGPGTITDWRGFLSPKGFEGREVLATLHVASLYEDPIMRLPTQLDWAKIPKILRGELPKPLPPYFLAEEGDATHVDRWFEAAMKAPFVVCDTEYDPDTKALHLIGLRANGVRESCLFDWRVNHDPWFRSHYAGLLQQLLSRVMFVFQNFLADGPVLEKSVGIRPRDFYKIADTMLAHAALFSEYGHKLEFIASLISQYPKLKHLAEENFYLYNHGDLLTTEEAWLWLVKGLEQDPLTAAVYWERVMPMLPILIRATQNGIRVDQEKAKEILIALEAMRKAASLLGAAWTGYPINVGSTQQIKRSLQHETINAKDTESDTILTLLRKHPENGLLQARMKHSQAEGFIKYVEPMTRVNQVFPEFLPTQNTGRISVKNPPLVNFPDDGKADARGIPHVRSLFLPYPGWWWLCFDYSAMHARFMAAACNDREDLEAFERGYDMHTITACRSLGLPLPPNLFDVMAPDNAEWRDRVKWQPKDRRRHLFKAVRYALLNGIDERAVLESKEVVEQNLDPQELVKVGRLFLQAKPAMAAWKRAYCDKALRDGFARSLYGRKRLLVALGEEHKSREERMKAAISGFLQMTEVDILQETIIYIAQQYPNSILVFPSHDGVKMAFPVTYNPHEVYDHVKPFVERTHDFGNGNVIAIPGEWEVLLADGRKETLK